MDPGTATIVTALVVGAAAAAKDVASTAIKDAYAGLKRLISDRYQKAGPLVEAIEGNPSSRPEQQVLANQLDQQGASADADLKNLAGQLLAAIERLREEPQAPALFDFDQLHALRRRCCTLVLYNCLVERCLCGKSRCVHNVSWDSQRAHFSATASGRSRQPATLQTAPPVAKRSTGRVQHSRVLLADTIGAHSRSSGSCCAVKSSNRLDTPAYRL